MAGESSWVKSFTDAAVATTGCAVVRSALTHQQTRWYSELRKPWFQTSSAAFPRGRTPRYGTTALGAARVVSKLANEAGSSNAPLSVADSVWGSFATMLAGAIARLNGEA